MGIDIPRAIWIGAPLVAIGFGVTLAGVGWFFVSDRRRPLPPAPQTLGSYRRGGRAPGLDRAWLAALLVVLAVGAVVRLASLESKSLSHPEVIVPGLDLPADLAMPPPRHGLVEAASWHFLAEAHPFGYYLAMWLWIKIFGASLLSIRLPEALMGAASVYLVYRIGRLAYGAHVGVVAAALLALHGFHVFWSQTARSYVPGACLGLLSTVLLLEIARGSPGRRWREAAYVATTVTGAMTVEFFWPLLAVQMVWVAGREWGPRPLPRMMVVQALAGVVAAPMLAHGVMLAWVPNLDPLSPAGAAPTPSVATLGGYFSFGFLFQHGAYDGGELELTRVASVALLVLALALIGFGLRHGTPPQAPPPGGLEPPSPWPVAVAAVGSSLTMLGFAFVAEQRRPALAVMSLVPLGIMLAPWIAARARPAIAGFGRRGQRLLDRVGLGRTLVALLAAGPVIVLFAVVPFTLASPRLFVQFVPYLMVLTAAGVCHLGRRRALAVALATVLGLLFATSTVVLRRAPHSARDYQGLARAMTAAMQPTDLVFTPPKHWAYTPMLWYLDHDRLVAWEYAEAARRQPPPRVWVLATLPESAPSPGVAEALSGYRVADRIVVQGIASVLYTPGP